VTYLCEIFDGKYAVQCVTTSPDPWGWAFWYTLVVTGVTFVAWPLLKPIVVWAMYGPVVEVQLFLVAVEVMYLAWWYDVAHRDKS
jgi:hypothetical protein